MSVLDEIADRLDCIRYEGYLSAKCIFHDDHTPSLMVYPDWYNCLSCGAKGKTAKLLDILDGKVIQKSHAPSKPHLWGKFEQEMDIGDLAYTAHQNLLRSPDNGYYLKQRGIASQIVPLQLGFLDGWYIFPVKDSSGNTKGLVARAGPVAQKFYNLRYVIPFGQKPMLYVPNWKQIEDEKYVIVVYGILDVITLSILGYPAVSGTIGHHVPRELFDSIRKVIYICPDGDGADDKTTRQLISQLGWRGKFLRLNYPDDAKDCNDIQCKYGNTVLHTKIKEKLNGLV